jgi:hypothetical protein
MKRSLTETPKRHFLADPGSMSLATLIYIKREFVELGNGEIMTDNELV